jgi:basic membrane protein A
LRNSRSIRLASAVVAGAMLFTACGDDEGDDGAAAPTTAAQTSAAASPTPSDTASPSPSDTASPSPSDTASPTESAAGGGGKVGLVYDIGGRGDKSFNDAAAAGLDKAKGEFGLETRELEPSGKGEDREELLNQLATGGYNYTIGVGFLFAESIKKAADANPDVTFGIVDSVVDDTEPEKKKFPNVKQMVFAEHEGSYLVGVAAALKSKAGKVGFVGGVEIDLIKKFEAGFKAGVEATKPGTKVDVKYITQPPDFGGFNDPAKGKEIAAAMYEGGSDVVYHAAGGSGTGVFEAAKEASGDKAGADQKWAIGVDSDQYQTAAKELQPFILTSMLKRVDVAVYESIKAFNGGDKTGGVKVFDLKVDGVGYSTSGGFVDDIKDQLEAAKAKIVSGDVKVPEK